MPGFGLKTPLQAENRGTLCRYQPWGTSQAEAVPPQKAGLLTAVITDKVLTAEF